MISLNDLLGYLSIWLLTPSWVLSHSLYRLRTPESMFNLFLMQHQQPRLERRDASAVATSKTVSAELELEQCFFCHSCCCCSYVLICFRCCYCCCASRCCCCWLRWPFQIICTCDVFSVKSHVRCSIRCFQCRRHVALERESETAMCTFACLQFIYVWCPTGLCRAHPVPPRR